MQHGLDEASLPPWGKTLDFALGRGRLMGCRMRQIGVVIGVTVILTFPVSVLSDAGSQRQLHHVAANGFGKGANAASGSGWHQFRDEAAWPLQTGRIDR